MTKMNPEVKARWVAALRSGEYKQGRMSLKDRGRYCCLGVLCDLYAQDLGMSRWGWKTLSQTADDHEDREDGLPSAQIAIWSGLDWSEEVQIRGHKDRLYNHNDGVCGFGAKSFAEIADAIEAQL